MSGIHARQVQQNMVDSSLRMQSCLQVIRFPEAVETALEELMPNRLTDYLYDLSDKFNSFYTECKVGLH